MFQRNSHNPYSLSLRNTAGESEHRGTHCNLFRILSSPSFCLPDTAVVSSL